MPVRGGEFAPNDRLIAYPSSGPLSISAGALTQGRFGQPVRHMRSRDLEITLGDLPPDPPLVSAMMVTVDRPGQARLAIGAFRRQTWPRRELVVFDTSTDRALANWIETLGDPAIRLIREAGSKAPLGALRNRIRDAAAGEFVCQWDDDDLSHPARIEAQMAALRLTGADASFLLRQMFWWPGRGRLGLTRHRPWEATMVARRSVLPDYPALARGEDTPALMQMLGSSDIVAADLPELYLYVVHGRNTWDEPHFEDMWRTCQKFEGSGYGPALARLAAWPGLDDYRTLLAGGP